MLRASFTRASIVVAALCVAVGAADAQRIQMPLGYRLTWIGARWNPDAKVVDQGGRPTGAALTYRMADPAVATVTSRGEVTARRPGNTRLWVFAGRDSASALIVVEQWPARFSFSPATVRLDAVGAKQALRVLASDSAGVPIVGGTLRAGACRSVNDRIASFTAGEVVSVANGYTWIRCSDRGIADSIRIDVQQRAVTALITNKSALRSRSAGDTFSVRVSSRDRMQKEVPDARPTWASLNPLAVSVDPLTGKARAVGGGDARVIVQVGDVADSVSITVSGALFQTPVVASTAVDSNAGKSKLALLAQEVFAYEAETTFVSITATDSAGSSVALNDVRFRILDSTIASKVDTARILGKKPGNTFMVVTYGGLADTALITVRQRTSGTTVSGQNNNNNNSNFRPPTVPDSTTQNQQKRRLAEDSIKADPLLNARRQNLVIVLNGVAGFTEHLSRADSGLGEDRTGPMFGGAGSILLWQRLEIAGALRTGTLASATTVSENLKVTEFDGSIGFFPVRSIGLRGGMLLRGESSDIALITMKIPKVSIVTRFNFIGDIFSTYASFSVLPKASFSEVLEKGSLLSRGGEAGIEFRLSRFNGGLTYFAEQISFDETPRLDTFSAIRFRVGFSLGK